MKYQLRIAGIDITAFVASSSVNFTTNKGVTPSTLSFNIDFPSKEMLTEYQAYVMSGYYLAGYAEDGGYPDVPYTGQAVEMYFDDSLIFGGNILRVEKSLLSAHTRQYQVECQDFSRIAQKGMPIAEIYENWTAGQIIKDLCVRYPAYRQLNTANVNCDILIDYLYIDHKTLWDVMYDLAQRTSYEFFIDESKKIFFHTPGTLRAPFDVNEINQTFLHNTLKIKEQSDRVFNLLIVQGGEYEGSETVHETVISDGTETIKIKNKYGGITVTVDGVQKTVGTYGLHNAADYDCLYDFSGRKVVFAVPVLDGATVVISGKQKLKVLVQVPEYSSITKYGVIPKKIKDTSLRTKESAFQRAKAELARNASEVEDGSFITRMKGFRAGQRVSIDFLGEKKDYDIESTSTSFYGEDEWRTRVTLASAEIVDAIKVLADMVRDKNTSQADEILDVLFGAMEQVNIGEKIKIGGDYKKNIEIQIQESIDYYQDGSPLIPVYGNHTPSDMRLDRRRNFHLDLSKLL